MTTKWADCFNYAKYTNELFNGFFYIRFFIFRL